MRIKKSLEKSILYNYLNAYLKQPYLLQKAISLAIENKHYFIKDITEKDFNYIIDKFTRYLSGFDYILL